MGLIGISSMILFLQDCMAAILFLACLYSWNRFFHCQRNGKSEWNEYHDSAHRFIDSNHPCDHQRHLQREALKSFRTWNWFCNRSDFPSANLYTDSWIWQ